jgi:hypothetical protein
MRSIFNLRKVKIDLIRGIKYEAEVRLQVFFIWALGVGEGSASFPSPYLSLEKGLEVL